MPAEFTVLERQVSFDVVVEYTVLFYTPSISFLMLFLMHLARFGFSLC